MFQIDYFEKLSANLDEAIKQICEDFINFDLGMDSSTEIDFYDNYIEAFAALETYINVNDLSNQYSIPQISKDKKLNIKLIKDFFNKVFNAVDLKVSEEALERYRQKYQLQFGAIFSYNFFEGDLTRIQELINELRDLITKSELFDLNHKERLLNKLESLQKELHKKMSNLDKFWGLIGDAGVVLGKFGTDAKPFVDRIKEITEIVWKAQSCAEKLPNGSPMPLLNKENNIT